MGKHHHAPITRQRQQRGSHVKCHHRSLFETSRRILPILLLSSAILREELLYKKKQFQNESLCPSCSQQRCQRSPKSMVTRQFPRHAGRDRPHPRGRRQYDDNDKFFIVSFDGSRRVARSSRNYNSLCPQKWQGLHHGRWHGFHGKYDCQT